MGNPKRSSVFICLKCLDWKFTYIQGIQRSNQRELGHIKDNVCSHCGENHILDGLQRGGHQREKKHIKDAFCIECQDITKNLEVRYCDSFDEMMRKAEELHREYYGKVG